MELFNQWFTQLTGSLGLATGLAGLVFALLGCFFGYRLIRLLVTVGGAALGAVLFISAKLHWLPQLDFPVWAAGLLGAVLVGLLSCFVYKAGLFCYFALMGGSFAGYLAPLLHISGASGLWLTLAAGLIIGVLGVILNRPYIICVTGISGGLSAGLSVFTLLSFSAPAFAPVLCGAVLAALGVLFQFKTAKR
ncbi:MAG: hypothetical protein Q4G07_01685 [Oscillospiraceae bacterium]|nr:hypothetical protein [Oscillospiraceae bacterium]